MCFELELEYLELDPLIQLAPPLELAALVELAPMQELPGQMSFIKIFIFKRALLNIQVFTEIFICNVKFFGSDGINSISGVCSKVNQITHRIELELELMPKNHENPSPDLDPALELMQP